MMKRVVALVLCLAAVLCCFTACSHGDEDKGAYIRMYLAEPVYDLDPLNAFDNEGALQIVSLLFEGLFTADENGKPKKALVDKYKYTVDKEEETYILSLTLKATKWSDGVDVKANDVQYAFRRIFDTDVHSAAAAMLFDIKNAREIAAGDQSVDHLGVTVVDASTVEIEFERDIEVDEFLLTLTSPALYPIRDDVADGNPDWAKKSSSIVCSGPFMVRSMKFADADGFILERNSYYFRDRQKDDLDKSVTPFRIVVDYKTKAEEQFKLFNTEDKGALYYVGEIPMSVRTDAAAIKKAEVTDTAATHVYYLNENAEIGDTKLFADAKVRLALSLAVDRDAIAKAVVFAKPATGIVPFTMRNRADKTKEFRKAVKDCLATSANAEAAKNLLAEANIKPAAYSFAITVASYDEEHLAIAELIKEAWSALGFKVSIKALGATERVETTIDEAGIITTTQTGIYDDAYKAALTSGEFEVIAADLVAYSPDTFAFLASFATAFSGNGYSLVTDTNGNSYKLNPHITGYASSEYNAKIEAAYAADKAADRAELLKEAEAILLKDMPVIPVIFHQKAALQGKKLGSVKYDFYGNPIFTKTKLSGYWDIALRDEFVKEKTEEEEESK